MSMLLCILFILTISGQAFVIPSSQKESVQKIRIRSNNDHPFSRSLSDTSSSSMIPIPTCPLCVRRTSSLSTKTSTSLSAVPIGALNAFYINFPYLSAFVTCGVKASVADVIAQKRQKKKDLKKKRKVALMKSPSESVVSSYKESSDKRMKYQRNIAFILYGGFYQGIAQEYIFNHLFPIWFGSGTGMRNVLTKVLFDTSIVGPMINLPIAYLVKALVFKYSPKEGLRRYKDDVLHHGLLKKYWSLWVPVQCLTFGVVPAHLRIAFIASVSFFWLIILSSISTKERAKSSSSSRRSADVKRDRDIDEELSRLYQQSKDIDLSIDDDYEYDDSCLLIDGLTCESSEESRFNLTTE